MLDAAGPYEVDGRWFCERGDVSIDTVNNRLKSASTASREIPIVRRGSRIDKYVATVQFRWTTNSQPGFLVRYLDPGNWLAIDIPSGGNAVLRQRKDDGKLTVLVTSGTTLLPTMGNWYTMKVVVDDDPGNSALQRLGWGWASRPSVGSIWTIRERGRTRRPIVRRRDRTAGRDARGGRRLECGANGRLPRESGERRASLGHG